MDVQSTQNDIKPNVTSINGIKDDAHLAPNGQLARMSAATTNLSHPVAVNGVDSSIEMSRGNEEVDEWPSLQDLEKELPKVFDGQVYLGFLMHQLVQDLYAQLLNIAETLGRASDTVKKAKLQQWLSLAYKQVSKVYVLAKWSRNADDIQKAMNIAAFLRTQGEQIIWATKGLHSVQDESHRMRVRNPDLLTALDVLTTGNYTRLASIHQETFVKKKPLTNKEVAGIFAQVEDVMRMRLLCKDIVPVEMGRWRIEGGRTFFTVPRRFETSLIMTGAQKDDIWAFVHVEFLFGVPEGERKGSKEFPKRPPKAFSDDLAFQIRDIIMTPPSLPDAPFASAVVDAPLVRVYNFLLLLSLSYQLEILMFQATQLLLHGWKDHLKLSVAINRKSFTVKYWVRPPGGTAYQAGIPVPPAVPWFGGEVTVSIVPVTNSSTSTAASQSTSRSFDPTNMMGSSKRPPNTPINPQSSSTEKEFRSPADRIKAEVQRRLKLRGASSVSDEVDHHKFDVQWKPQPNAMGVVLTPSALDHSELEIDSDCLDFESLLTRVLRRHADVIMDKHLENAKTLATSDGAILFPHPDEITLTQQGEGKAIRVQLSGNQFIVISMEAESGRYIVNESGDLGGATRGVRWKSCQKHINQTPMSFLELCWRVRHAATIENIETRANLLGIHTFRQRNLRAATLTQFGVHTGVVYLQLADFPQHYVAIISSHAGLKFALVELQEHLEYGMGTGEYYISDFGWVQAEKFFQLYSQGKNDVQGDEMDIDLTTDLAEGKVLSGQKRKRPQGDVGIRLPPDHVPATRDPLDLSVQEIRDLHAYCRARVAHTLIESQLKARNIPYIHVRPPLSGPRLPIPKAPAGSKVPVAQQKALETLRRRQLISKSPLEAYLPILSVRSSDLLAGAAAAEAAMPNIRIEPIEWWSLDKDCMVNTSVQLKYVQPLDQPRGSKGAPNGKIICPSENISYDTRTSVITFLSRKVSDCVDEFLKEWARVSKVVVIARQISLMPDKKGWKDVRILSFDLQTVEFAYCRDYSLSITSVDGIYRLSFSRCSPLSSSEESMKMSVDATNAAELQRNAHQDCAKFAQELLKDDRLGASVFELVGFLRNTVNVVEMLDILEEEESVRSISANQGSRFDVLVKATGWWRIRYSLSTLFASSEEAKSFALDVRLIKGRIMLVDGSVNLGTGKIAVHSPMNVGTAASVGTTTATTGGAGSNGGTGPGAAASASSSNTGAGTSSSQRTLPVPLLPINKMEEYVGSVLEEVGKEAEVSADGVYPVNYGLAIICGCAGAPKLMKTLHEKILGGL